MKNLSLGGKARQGRACATRKIDSKKSEKIFFVECSGEVLEEKQGKARGGWPPGSVESACLAAPSRHFFCIRLSVFDAFSNQARRRCAKVLKFLWKY